MGLIIKSDTSLEGKSTRVVLPVNDNLLGAYFFSSGALGKNYAPNSVKPTVFGTPNQSSQHGQILDRNNYIDTNISVANRSNTLIAVFKNNTTTGSKPIVTNYATPDTTVGTGSGLYLKSANLVNIGIYNKSTAAANINGEQVGGYSTGNFMVAGILNSNGANVTNTVCNLKTLSKAVASVSDSVGLGYSGDGTTYRIGNFVRETTSIGTVAYGEIEFYAVLIYDRALNDTELSKISEWVKSFCINRSIIV